MIHLKSQQYYSDLYDRHTVDICRRAERSFKNKDTDHPLAEGITEEEARGVKKFAMKWYLHMEMGERYLNKEKTVQEWMETDRRKDELYESAQAPEDIRCFTCRNRLKPTFKELWSEIDKPDRVLFMYDCPNKCLPRRAFFSDGEEWRVKPILCPKCDTSLDQKADDNGEKLITTRTCSKCGYSESDEMVWKHKKDEGIDENFAKDRDRFCMTDEEGKKFQEEKWNLQQIAKFVDEWKEKDKVREEKLKANPKGFHLDGVGYRCAICHDSTKEGDNWYDEFGIKCLVCQKAIDDGEIPASLAKDEDSWYSKFELDHYFNLKGPVLRKWIKEGIIKPRVVSHYGKGVHVELFLLEDNKEFLPPKKLVESRSVKTRKDGKDWFTTEKWYRFVDPYEHLKGYKILDHLKFTVVEENNEN
ncbi:hypothetical protein C4572_01565 [Candidatus Parcubacteria bacterium]|nr:MAG: hypothetical protein C4572_01565 [Candidatus Parcubacteria bacterium]